MYFAMLIVIHANEWRRGQGRFSMDPGERSRNAAKRLLRLLPRFQRWEATAVQAGRGGQDLSLRQLAVLYLVREGAVFPHELARQLRIAPAVVTGLLDRLEQRGYLRRLTDPSDRRRLRLALTDAGLAASLAVEQMLSNDVAAHLDRAPVPQLDALEEALDLLALVVDDLEQNQPRLGPVPVEDKELWDAPERDAEATGSAAAVG
jgi:DNA-binding MarR family transcriptional regulator